MRSRNLTAGVTGLAVAVLAIASSAFAGHHQQELAAGSSGGAAAASAGPTVAAKPTDGLADVKKASNGSPKPVSSLVTAAKDAQAKPAADQLTSAQVAATLGRLLHVTPQRAATALAQLETAGRTGRLDASDAGFQAVARELGLTGAQLDAGLMELKKSMVAADGNAKAAGADNLLTDPRSAVAVARALHVSVRDAGAALAQLARRSVNGSLEPAGDAFQAVARSLGVSPKQLVVALDKLKQGS